MGKELEIRAYIFDFAGYRVLLRKIGGRFEPFTARVEKRTHETKEDAIVRRIEEELRVYALVLRNKRKYCVAKISEPGEVRSAPKEYSWFDSSDLGRESREGHVSNEVMGEISEAYEILDKMRK